MTRFGGMLLVLALLVSACSSPSGSDAEPAGADPAAAGDEVAAGSDTTITADTDDTDDATSTSGDSGSGAPLPDECPAPPDGVPWTDSETAGIETLQEQTADTPGVQAVVYPRPDYEGRPWSQWGQGILLADGRFLSAIGDHHGPDGNSFMYEFDPETGLLTQIGDALSLVDHIPGEYGFGKIHAPMVAGPCGEIYTSTYWGTRRRLEYTENYTGDVLIRIDPEQRSIASMGVLVPEHGAASMASWPEGGLIYAEPADPFGQKTGAFVAVDAFTGETVFETFDDAHDGYRTIAVDEQGRAHIAWGADGIARFDPATNEIEVLDVAIPGGSLRATTRPDADGTIYGASRENDDFFALHADGTVRPLGTARGYVSTMVLAPEGGRFYYIPHAHGRAWEEGTPLIAVGTETGAEEVVIELNPLIEDQLGLRTGGTYSISVDPSSKTFYIGLNAGDPASRDTFGEVVLVVVTLP